MNLPIFRQVSLDLHQAVWDYQTLDSVLLTLLRLIFQSCFFLLGFGFQVARWAFLLQVLENAHQVLWPLSGINFHLDLSFTSINHYFVVQELTANWTIARLVLNPSMILGHLAWSFHTTVGKTTNFAMMPSIMHSVSTDIATSRNFATIS